MLRLAWIGFQNMARGIKWIVILFLGFASFSLPLNLCAMTAHEILEQGAQQTLGGSFRIALTVKAFKNNKPMGEHALWLMAKVDKDKSSFFVDFDSPPESKGLRFLLQLQKNSEPRVFMYLPATDKTVPLAVDDQSADMGGTGLTMEDIQGFVPRADESSTVVREETIEGRECYVIKIVPADKSGERLLWVSKKDLFVVKSEQLDPQGKVKRTFRVVQFFKTDQGKEFPREEEILIPDKKIRIQVRQDNAVFGIEIPDQVMDPETFGTYKWKG